MPNQRKARGGIVPTRAELHAKVRALEAELAHAKEWIRQGDEGHRKERDALKARVAELEKAVEMASMGMRRKGPR